MKLAFLINDLQKGGAERLVKDLAIEMEALDVVEPVVIVANDYGELWSELEASDVELVSLNVDISTTSVLNSVQRLSTVLQKRNIELVHSHLPFSHLVGRLACVHQSVPHVATYHNIKEHKTLLKRLVERLTRPLSDRIICVSKGVLQSYSTTDNMNVIYNAIDVTGFNERVLATDPPEHGAKFDNDTTIFLNVARCVKQKRQEDILEALSMIDTDNIHLFIVGDGPRKKMLKELSKEKGLTNCVTITGYVPAVEPYYGIADAFVSASSNEGLPTTHIEAMAAKLPIVSTEIPGVNEVVEHGKNGYLCPVKEPTELAANMELICANEAQSLGEHGFEIAASKFSLSVIVSDHLNLYQEVIGDQLSECEYI